MFKSGIVSVVGSPNAGKSTLVNEIVGRKVSIVTDKVHTTRKIIRGVYNEEEAQIVFVDTPGFLKPLNRLQVYMAHQIEESFENVDVVIYILDGRYGVGKKERENLEKLKHVKCKKIAFINKIDLLNQEQVVSIINSLNDTELFDDVLAMSLKEGFNVTGIVDVIKPYLSGEDKFFEEEVFTDLTDNYFAAEIIREHILHLTKNEVPHSVSVEVTSMEDDPKTDVLIVSAEIYVERDSQKAIIIGKAGSMIKQIGMSARKELKTEFKQPVYLDLHVKVRKKWDNDATFLNQIGYDI